MANPSPDDPAPDDPAADDPAAGDPAAGDPAAGDPAAGAASPDDPAAGDTAPEHRVLGHRGPWTEATYRELDGTSVPARVELLDGSLLIGPAADDAHRALVERLRAALATAVPEGLSVVGPVALRVAAGRVLRPDLVVLAGADGAEAGGHVAPERVLQVLEVAGPGNALADRRLKPQLYAEAAIPYYLRVERSDDGPVAVAFLLIGGRYLENVRTGPGEALRLDEPYPMTVDLAGD